MKSSPEHDGEGENAPFRLGISGKLAKRFLHSRLTPIFVIVSLLLGGLAILKTPREEDPQIRVPVIDLF